MPTSLGTVAVGPPRRDPHIDLLRGLSVLVVMITHFGVCGPFTGTAVVANDLMGRIAWSGYYGVSVFFVISGFVITSTSLRRYGTFGRVRIWEFYANRISRILPPLSLLVGLNLACLWLGAPGFQLTGGISVAKLLGHVFSLRFNLLYLQGGSLLLPWAPLWSLAIEEIFYCAFPLLFRLLRKESAVVAVLALAVVAGPLYRRAAGPDALYLYPGCFDQLALGCLTAIAVQRVSRAKWSDANLRNIRLAGYGGLFFAYFAANVHDANVWIFGPTEIAVAVAIILLGTAPTSPAARADAAKSGPALIGRGIGRMGSLSYELYLFHLPAYLLLGPALHAMFLGVFGCYPRDGAFALSTMALGALSFGLSAGFSDPIRVALRSGLTRRRFRLP